MPPRDGAQNRNSCLIYYSHGIVCGWPNPYLPTLLPPCNSVVHLIRVIGGEKNHGQSSRSSPATTEKLHFVYFVVDTLDMWKQMATNHADVARPLVYGHARPSHVHRWWVEGDLKVFESGHYQQLFGTRGEKIG